MTVLVAFGILCGGTPVCGLNVFRDGHSSVSQGLGGIDTVGGRSAIDALSGNPAQLTAFDENRGEFGLAFGKFDATFSNATNSGVPSVRDQGLAPALASVWHREDGLAFGFGIIPEIGLASQYTLLDPPGGLGGATSYGFHEHSTEFIAVRATAAVGWQISEQFSVGAGAGLVYTRNQLVAPYIFQSAPGLAGFKTLLDLETDGVGFAAQLGVTWKPVAGLELGASFQPEITVNTSGESYGDASAQLLAAGPPLSGAAPGFHYDTDIATTIPAHLQVGARWQATPVLALFAQVDWIGSGDAYDQLTIELSNGSNADLNGLLGTDAFVERSPLDWDNQIIYRVGAEYVIRPGLRVLAGLAHGENPVPDATVTPLTGAISETVLGVGIISEREFGWTIGGSFQYLVENTATVADSALLAGEYDNSHFSLEGFWLTLTASRHF